MLDLFAIALASIAVAAIAVWIYRKMTESRGVTTSLVSLSDHRDSLRLNAQQGYVRLQSSDAARRTKSKTTFRKKGSKDVRKPWGW